MEEVEDGEVNSCGFLDDHELAARNALAAAAGGEGMSWVEAVLTGGGGSAGEVDPNEKFHNDNNSVEATGRGDVAGKDADASQDDEPPPPPGTVSAGSKPPPSAVAIARREAALVHRVMGLLGDEDKEKDAAGELLSLLAEAGADGVDVPRWLGHGRSSNRGRTPLMEAAMQGRTACTATLAEAARSACAKGGRGLNARNERGRYSALHYACYHGHAGAALELLVRGADPRLRNRDNETALQAALANDRADCAELVRDFLRRPTFEPDESTPRDLMPAAPAAIVDHSSREPPQEPAATEASRGSNSTEGGRVGVSGGGDGSGAGVAVGSAVGGVAGVAPEVSRANTVYCLGRRRRRLGARIRPGRGLGVGVGTAAAEVSLGVRKRARLHAVNPCAGTPMEAFVLWSIATGHDPFHGEGGEEEESGGGGTANEVWLEYYVRVYNASVRRWRTQQLQQQQQAKTAATEGQGEAQRHRNDTVAAVAATTTTTVAASSVAATPSNYFLVVKKSKALAEGRRFELPCGTDVVIGRSQHLAGIVVKDEMVSKVHLRVKVSASHGFRVLDLGSKHGAVITKPAPPARPPPPSSKHRITPTAPAASAASAVAAVARPSPTLPKKFFPIPIPREPEWVAGAHGDSITLGKTTFDLEREGGAEPPRVGRPMRYRPPAAGRGVGGLGAAAAVAPEAKVEAEGGVLQSCKRPVTGAAVISKGFTANPNLLDAIRSAEEMERVRKRKAASSEVAAAAAAAFLSNKRSRSSSRAAGAAAGAAAVPPPAAPTSARPEKERLSAVSENQPWQQQQQQQIGGEIGFEHVSKGSMLLRRMGWTEGQGLGRRSDGQLQPVQVVRRGDREGLGAVQSDGNSPFAMGADGRISKWEHMRRRFSHAQQSAGASYRDRQQLRRAGGAGQWLPGGVEGGTEAESGGK